MKIYTKRGDEGKTDLIGKRVTKTSLRIEVNGNIDELTGFINFAKVDLKDSDIDADLENILKTLLQVSYEVAKGPVKLGNDSVTYLEERIDFYESKMEPLKVFITFDTNKHSAILNICRTVARRSERYLYHLHEAEELNPVILKYFNRLSDFFFVTARYLKENE